MVLLRTAYYNAAYTASSSRALKNNLVDGGVSVKPGKRTPGPKLRGLARRRTGERGAGVAVSADYRARAVGRSRCSCQREGDGTFYITLTGVTFHNRCPLNLPVVSVLVLVPVEEHTVDNGAAEVLI